MARMPQVSARELVRFLEAQEFAEDRQAGSHLTVRNPARALTVTVPIHTGSDVDRGVRILKDAASPSKRISGYDDGRRRFGPCPEIPEIRPAAPGDPR